jgi:hypothetical protein
MFDGRVLLPQRNILYQHKVFRGRLTPDPVITETISEFTRSHLITNQKINHMLRRVGPDEELRTLYNADPPSPRHQQPLRRSSRALLSCRGSSVSPPGRRTPTPSNLRRPLQAVPSRRSLRPAATRVCPLPPSCTRARPAVWPAPVAGCSRRPPARPKLLLRICILWFLCITIARLLPSGAFSCWLVGLYWPYCLGGNHVSIVSKRR